MKIHFLRTQFFAFEINKENETTGKIFWKEHGGIFFFLETQQYFF